MKLHKFFLKLVTEVSIQEVLSRADEFLPQKFTVLNINDELYVQFENQVLPDLRRH